MPSPTDVKQSPSAGKILLSIIGTIAFIVVLIYSTVSGNYSLMMFLFSGILVIFVAVVANLIFRRIFINHNKTSIAASATVGVLFLLAVIVFVKNESPLSNNHGNTFINEAEQQISSQTGSAAVGAVVDQVEMRGMHNEILFIDYLIEVKADSKYYYVVHRDGGSIVPSYTRTTTWPYSVIPIRNKRTLRGMLTNG